jgi:hypothetical protein
LREGAEEVSVAEKSVAAGELQLEQSERALIEKTQ